MSHAGVPHGDPVATPKALQELHHPYSRVSRDGGDVELRFRCELDGVVVTLAPGTARDIAGRLVEQARHAEAEGDPS